MSLQLGIPLFIGAVLLQSTILPRIRLLGGQPDLVLLVVFAWAMLDREQEGVVWAFVGGFLLDIFSGVPLGVSALALVPVTLVVSLAEPKVFRESVLPPLLLTAVGAAGYHLLVLLLLRFYAGFPIEWESALLFVTLPSILLDVLLILPVLRLLVKPYDRLHPRVLGLR